MPDNTPADEHPWALEPWQDYGDVIFDDENAVIAQDYGAGQSSINKVNFSRIVACVNACAGIPTEVLEGVLMYGKAHYNAEQAKAAALGPVMTREEYRKKIESGEIGPGEIHLVERKPEATDDH